MAGRDRQKDDPSSRANANVFAEVVISVERLEDPSIDALLDAFRGVYANGDARFASFLIDRLPVPDDSTTRGRLGEVRFWLSFLASEPVSSELSWLGKVSLESADRRLDELNAFYLDGDLAKTLMDGGAYSSRRFPGTADEARRLGLDFCSALFDGRWDEVIVRTTRKAWAGWFMGAPWDRTWLGFDRTARRVWMLCVKDTD